MLFSFLISFLILSAYVFYTFSEGLNSDPQIQKQVKHLETSQTTDAIAFNDRIKRFQKEYLEEQGIYLIFGLAISSLVLYKGISSAILVNKNLI